MSVQSDIAIFAGEDVTLNFQLGPPQDVTSWTFTSNVKDKLGGTVIFSPAITVVDGGRGRFKATFTRAQTSGLQGNYVWDVRRTDSGFNTVLAHGELTVRQPVTP
jgi:hypothetical protein